MKFLVAPLPHVSFCPFLGHKVIVLSYNKQLLKRSDLLILFDMHLPSGYGKKLFSEDSTTIAMTKRQDESQRFNPTMVKSIVQRILKQLLRQYQERCSANVNICIKLLCIAAWVTTEINSTELTDYTKKLKKLPKIEWPCWFFTRTGSAETTLYTFLWLPMAVNLRYDQLQVFFEVASH